jgi:hypothetical protein
VNVWSSPRTSRYVRIFLLICLSVITVSLYYYAYLTAPIQIADVTPQITVLTSIGTLDIHAAGRVDHGAVPLVISGSISDPTVTRLTLITRFPGSAVGQVQTSCCAISDQTFVGTAQLGTESPVTGTPAVVAFQLVANGSNTIEAAGNIAVQVETFPGGGSQLAIKVIAGLSLIAALVALLTSFPRFGPERTGHEPQN